MTPPHADRRTVLRTAAWATPAVLATSAAPAFATSDPPALVVARGTTSLRDFYTSLGHVYWGPVFAGFSVASTKALAAGSLKVRMAASSPTATAYLYTLLGEVTNSPHPWLIDQSQGTTLPVLSFTYPSAVPANTHVPLSGKLALVMNSEYKPIANSTVTVAVSAANARTVALTFTSPPAAAGRDTSAPNPAAGHGLRIASGHS